MELNELKKVFLKWDKESLSYLVFVMTSQLFFSKVKLDKTFLIHISEMTHAVI